MYLAVDLDALDTVVPDAWKRLHLVDGVVDPWGQVGWSDTLDESAPHLIVNAERTDVTWARDHAPWSGMSRTWAEEVWGPAPTSTVFLYTAGDKPVEVTLLDYDLEAVIVGTNSSFSWYGAREAANVAAFTAPFLAIAVALMIVLAWSGQRLRARDNATLLALGAAAIAAAGAALVWVRLDRLSPAQQLTQAQSRHCLTHQLEALHSCFRTVGDIAGAAIPACRARRSGLNLVECQGRYGSRW